jgi:hypothetical protein
VFCEEAILKVEPRVDKVVCRAGPNPDEPNRLDIRIEYVIAGKNDQKRNLVFPFYLKPEDETEPADNGISASATVVNNA